ncbi:coiled-coil domain-containing protein 22 homolog [Nephila pilipes]|uniref:Coiled-coil domain-containing protein 22 homolog n=1 Tax=Nephila pilipes TaxID=299642 RepID=A0A8X6UA33_NEPPI|nr:coiled-coil domain-containing protein 22 homolog [Nephila pilipes]GFU15352.1 coiled-coil domain-containing protein 22 homolog [Nephila pilipes]
MEEVDEIVLHTLRQIGCDVSEINSLKEFTTEAAIEGVVRCLKLINPSLELSHHVPPNMSARYRLGSTLATICTELGYKGEIGYQTFLYSNETDLRKIFLFLFENLPKETEKALDEPLNLTSLIIKEAGSSLTRSLNYPWLPHYCKSDVDNEGRYLLKNPLYSLGNFRPVTLFRPFNYAHIKNKGACMKYCEHYLQLVPKQVNVGPCLLSSVLETNTLDYVKQLESERNQDDLTTVLNRKELISQKREKINKIINEHLLQALQQSKHISAKLDEAVKSSVESRSSRFTHSLELQFTPDKKENIASLSVPTAKVGDTEEDMQKKRETEIKELQQKLDSLTTKLENLSLENKNYEATSQNSLEQIKKEQETIDDLKERYRVKKCTLSLLPDAETNIEKLQAVIEASSQRLVSLANQWEQHRVPLIDQYRELRELSSRRVNETQRKLEEIKVLREKIKSLGVEARQKEEMHKHLVTAYEKLTKDVSRSAYTRRIMEIVGNIKKQKAEIDKVLLDTRNVQKEINKLSGKLERTFTVTDELIFKDAKKDEAIRRAYKYLAALHENCNQLVLIVEETGAIAREIRELEDQIEQENQKKVAATLERITSDYKQMQQENASLLAQLK